MIAAILITALVMGYPWHRAVVQRDAALRLAVSAMAAKGRADRERDEALSSRPVAPVVPIRKGGGLA